VLRAAWDMDSSRLSLIRYAGLLIIPGTPPQPSDALSTCAVALARSFGSVSGIERQAMVAAKKKRLRPSRRVLAVASGGGHWVQLMRLRAAWDGCDVVYATTRKGYEKDLSGTSSGAAPQIVIVPDANRNQPFRLLFQVAMLAIVLFRARPEVVVTTGASVGYFALRLGKLSWCAHGMGRQYR
jgi:hypothetical protein